MKMRMSRIKRNCCLICKCIITVSIVVTFGLLLSALLHLYGITQTVKNTGHNYVGLVPEGNMEFENMLHHVWWQGYGNMPTNWNTTISETKNINNDIKQKLWSQENVETLLEEDFPWFLDTYHSYPYIIQRMDVVRYFILLKYGGTYLDMDVGTRVPLNRIIKEQNLTKHDCTFLQTNLEVGVTIPAISNDIMICNKNSPFLAYLISRLPTSNRWYLLPYLTVMFSTGPAFVHKTYQEYDKKDNVLILPNKLYREEGGYFKHVKGESWHGWDAHYVNKFKRFFLFWDGKLYTLIICSILFLTLFIGYVIYKIRLRNARLYRRDHCNNKII